MEYIDFPVIIHKRSVEIVGGIDSGQHITLLSPSYRNGSTAFYRTRVVTNALGASGTHL